MLPKAVKEATEDALVRPAIRVREQHVHIPAGRLAPSVGTARHAQQPGIEGLSRFTDLGKNSEGLDGWGAFPDPLSLLLPPANPCMRD